MQGSKIDFMFEDFIWFFIICALSLILSKVVFSSYLGPFRVILHYCAIVGVFIHECSHFLACVIMHVPVTEFSVRASKKRIEGHVSIGECAEISFMQSLIVAIAPLIFSTWLFFFCLETAFSSTVNLLTKVISGFVAFSLLFGASPSVIDLKFIKHYFNFNRRYSYYQIILVLIASGLVWCLDSIYQWQFFYFVYYFVIGGAYYFLKYSIKTTQTFYRSIHYRERKRMRARDKFDKFSKKRFKPIKPSKMGLEEAQW